MRNSELIAPIGVDENNRVVNFSFAETSILIGGQRRAGKSGFINCMIAGLAQMDSVALIGIDLKGGVSLSPWKDRLSDFVYTNDRATEVLLSVEQEMLRRFEYIRENGLEKIESFTPSMPKIEVIIDEVAEAFNSGDKTGDIKRYECCRRIVSLSGAAGIDLIVATQKPSLKNTPTDFRDLIQRRIALATSNREMTKMILGDAAGDSAPAHEIAENQKGMAYVMNDDSRVPFRMRGYEVNGQMVSLIAGQTKHKRVQLDWLTGALEVPEIKTPTSLEKEDNLFMF
jgi:DNA segregation ATPase FtsK/SpoIIIE, S-DNA-T family